MSHKITDTKTTGPLEPAADRITPFVGSPPQQRDVTSVMANRSGTRAAEVAGSPTDHRKLLEENRRLRMQGRRRCTCCHRVKDLDRDYSPSGLSRQSRCKMCRASKKRARWAADPKAARTKQESYREVVLLRDRDPSIPLLDVPHLPDTVLVENLDEIVASINRETSRGLLDRCGFTSGGGRRAR